MSELKQVDTEQVSQIVDNFLSNKNIKLSKQYVDTYYLWGHDTKTLLSVTRDISPDNKTSYSIVLDGIGATFKPSPEFAEKVYKLIDKDTVVGQSQMFTTSADAKKEWADKYAHASVKEKEKFLCGLLGKGCVYSIGRTFYYFDNPHSKKSKGIPSTFQVFQHDAKLVEYSGPRKVVWFYTDNKHATGFKEMNLQSGKIFNMVKIALQNQKQNVK
jgi:hypothetical protein